MTKPQRKIGEIEKIKDIILNNALDIIINHGFENVTMRKIALISKMSATNLYNYFANKDEIYLSIMIKGFENLKTNIDNALSDKKDPMQRGRTLMNEYLKFGLENPYYYNLMFIRPTPKYNDYIGTPQQKLAEVELNISIYLMDIAKKLIIEITKPESDSPEGDIQIRFMEIWGLLHGLLSIHISRNIDYITENPAELYEKIVDDIINLIIKNFK